MLVFFLHFLFVSYFLYIFLSSCWVPLWMCVQYTVHSVFPFSLFLSPLPWSIVLPPPLACLIIKPRISRTGFPKTIIRENFAFRIIVPKVAKAKFPFQQLSNLSDIFNPKCFWKPCYRIICQSLLREQLVSCQYHVGGIWLIYPHSKQAALHSMPGLLAIPTLQYTCSKTFVDRPSF